MDKSMYQWGYILEATEKAYAQFGILIGSPAICLGTVGPETVRVLRKEQRTPLTYHYTFWSSTNRKIRLL